MPDTDLLELDSGESETIGRIIADGFIDDPINRWAFNDTSVMQPLYTTMARHLYLPKGFGHKTPDDLAGTLWLPPGVKKHFGLMPTLAMGRSIWVCGGPRAVYRSVRLDGKMTARQPKEPHFYLFAIAVHPSLQGEGRGGRLIRAGLRRADEMGMPVYLENSNEKNLGFYRQHGFRVIDEFVPGPGCTPMWCMWREASRDET